MSAKTVEEILPHLETWARICVEADAQIDALVSLTGASPESKLVSAWCKLHEAYTDAVSEIVGDCDKWLSWHYYDNEMGARNFEIHANEKVMKITTLADLARAIVETRG